MTGAPQVVTVQDEIQVIVLLLRGQTRESAAAAVGLPVSRVESIAGKAGWPNPAALRRALEVKCRLAGTPSPLPRPASSSTSEPGGWSVPLVDVHPDPANPRGEALGDVASLAQTMADTGLLAPIVVRPRPAGGWWVVDGHRRLAAARGLGWERIDAVRRDLANGQAALAAMLVADLQREPLNPMAHAQALDRYAAQVDDFSRTRLAQLLGVSRSWVSNRLDLLALDEALQADVASGKLAPRRALRMARVAGTGTHSTVRREPCPACGRPLPSGGGR